MDKFTLDVVMLVAVVVIFVLYLARKKTKKQASANGEL